MVLCIPPTITANTSTKVWNPNNHRYEVPLDMVEMKLCADAAGQCLHWASAHSHICSTTEQWQSLTSSQVFSLLFHYLQEQRKEGTRKNWLLCTRLVIVFLILHTSNLRTKAPREISHNHRHTDPEEEQSSQKTHNRGHKKGTNPQGFKRRARTSIQKNLNRQSSAAAACDSSTIAAWQDP